jgi:uncharacterized cupin superfamily protein
MPHALRPIRIDPDALHLEPLELDPADFQSPLPVQHYALVHEDEGIGLAVGIWDTTTMQESFGPYPGDEFITVLDGRFTMVDAGQAVLATAAAGDSMTFRNATPSSWKQEGYLRKIYLVLKDEEGGPPPGPAEQGFRVLTADSLPQAVPGTDGVAREVVFRNRTGRMTVTLCAFPALEGPLEPCPTHRLIRVLRGTLTLASPDGQAERFAAGAHLFLPRGTSCATATQAGTVAVIVDVTAA